jgi:4-hydroxybenzoate polyprenyltransferase
MAALLPYLRLLRAGTLFSPAADVIAGRCIVAHATGLAVWSDGTAMAALCSVLLYAGGMVCNDVADVAEDRRRRPERPIPSGAIARPVAATLALLLLTSGVALSPMPSHHAVIAVLVLAYDFACKRNIFAGALTMGILRALNLATAAAPVWESCPMPLAIAALCYGVYIFAVTILGTFEDDPTVRPRTVVAIQAAPMWAALGGLLAVQDGLWPAPMLALVPIIGLARRNRSIQRWDTNAIRGSMGFLLLGTMVYTALLCAAADRWFETTAISCCIPLARTVTKRLRLRVMT